MSRKLATAFFFYGVALTSSVLAGTNQPLSVITSAGFSQVYEKVLPEFEQKTGIQVETSSGASQGSGPETIRYQLEHGAKADVVILTQEGFQNLIEDGHVISNSEKRLATVPLVAAVRTGSPKPDIGTDAAFRKALIDAEQITMAGSSSGQFVRDQVFPKLDLPNTVTLTLVARAAESKELLKTGKANLAIGPASELVNVPGIEVIGMLPNNLQFIDTYTAGIVKGSKNVKGAQRLINYLTNDSTQLIQAISTAGMAPVSHSKMH